MARILFIFGVVLLVALVGLIGYNALFQPAKAQNAWLEKELGTIKPVKVDFQKQSWDFAQWDKDIVGKSSLWNEIVAAPPPPPPPEERPPDLKEKLQGVEVTRQQVGDRVKIKTPEDQKGTFYSVGDTINGLTIKEVDRKFVTFSLTFKGKELTARLERQ